MKSRVPVLIILSFIAAGYSGHESVSAENPAGDESVPALTAPAPENRLPDHEISYPDGASPEWKLNWDQARSLYREGKYQEALVQYEILFGQKDNIEEARWEYATILLYLARWEKAKIELEKLLAQDPESIRYRLAMSTVNLRTGNLEAAIAHLVQLQGQKLSPRQREKVLRGLKEAYVSRGQNRIAAGFLEQLVALSPRDYSLLKELVAMELEMGNYLQAKTLCDRLEKETGGDVSVYSLQARIEDRLGRRENASLYWQMVIAANPEDVEAHAQLSNYYYTKKDWEMSFRHLEPLLKDNPADIPLLIRAADVNMRMKRVDRALKYFEYGLAVDPKNEVFLDGKRRAQKILATDLLSLVMNEGVETLWLDLSKVTTDRAGVFREIAGLLRERGSVSELIEVLKLLNRQDPGNAQVSQELTSLLKRLGRQDELTQQVSGKSATNPPKN